MYTQRFKALQAKFSALREEWQTVKSLEGRQRLLRQMGAVIDEANALITLAKAGVAPTVATPKKKKRQKKKAKKR